MMIDKIKEHIAKIEDFTAKTKEELEQFRIQYLGKKGVLNDFFAAFKEVPSEEKKTFGQVVNELKQKAEAKVQEWRDRLEERNESNGIYGDLSRPAAPAPIGARHPISLVKNEIVKIFANIGFDVSDGPEMEDDWHNFTALNLPEYHPTARNVSAPHPASQHAIARVLHATRCEFASSSRPDAAPSAAPTKTRRAVPKSSLELRKKSQLSAKNGAFSSRLLHPAARTPRLERHGAPFSVCTGLSPWRAPRRNTVCAHRMAENRKENYSRNRSFTLFTKGIVQYFLFAKK